VIDWPVRRRTWINDEARRDFEPLLWMGFTVRSGGHHIIAGHIGTYYRARRGTYQTRSHRTPQAVLAQIIEDGRYTPYALPRDPR
jgi:hypothetical protein